MRIPTVEIVVSGRRKIVNANDPRVKKAEAPAEGISPEDIDRMKRADLVELLKAHGADASGKLPDLRKRLKAVMFVDI